MLQLLYNLVYYDNLVALTIILILILCYLQLNEKIMLFVCVIRKPALILEPTLVEMKYFCKFS